MKISYEQLFLFDILCEKIIFPLNNSNIIKINLINFISTFLHDDCSYTFLLYVNKLSVFFYTNDEHKCNIKLSLQVSIVDSEERRTIIKKYKLYNIRQILCENKLLMKDIENNTIVYNFNDVPDSSSLTIGIKIYDFKNLSKIIINIENYTLELNKNLIEMYDNIYKKILYKINDYHVISLNFLIGIINLNFPFDFIDKITNNKLFDFSLITLKKNISIIYENLNSDLVNKYSLINDVFFYKNIFEHQNVNFYISLNTCTFLKNYKFILNKQNYNQNLVICENFKMSLREIIIYYKLINDDTDNNNNYIELSDKFELTINDNIFEYNKADCDIYKVLHHKHDIHDKIYTIGFSININYQNGGNFSVGNKITIQHFINDENVKLINNDNIEMHIILSGIKKYDNININKN
jgi:hypothetical protein